VGAPVNVLFLCTGNSARSILAEALLNHLPPTRGRFRAYSAGSHPKGRVAPLALEVLERHDIPTAGLRSKSWDEFSGPEAPQMDLVVTVCDQAAAEQCPYWPGHPTTAHWGIPDPAAVGGSDDDKRAAFEETFHVLRRRVEALATLPIASVNSQVLRQQLEEIARDTRGARPPEGTGLAKRV
jgi:arsenate reductase